MRIIAAAVCGVLTLVAPAFGADANAALKARAEALIAAEPDGGSVWKADETGRVHHIQSGMECLPGWPIMMPLSKLTSFPSEAGQGTDVACDYASQVDSSKLDIYAQKLPPGIGLDAAFARYRAEVVDYHSDARSLGSFADIKSGGLKLPESKDIRTEIFTYKDGTGTPSHSYLLVTQQDGWTVEVRLTKPVESDAQMTNRLFAFVALAGARQAIAKANGHTTAP